MTSLPGPQTITIHILSNISRSKSNQTMKFGQLMKYNKIFSIKNHVENEAERLVPDLFLVCSLSSIYFDSPQLSIQQKTNCNKL